jgi:sugar transferase (PEP-CTERM/EpsH1 system associated)
MQQAIANERQSGRAPAEGAVLLLCHRVPYPPDKGDKIRSYRWLTGLAERYRVYLGAFVDDPADWVHAERLQACCAELCLLPLVPLRAKLRGLPALLRAEPLTCGYYRDRRMSAWVARVLARGDISRVVVFSSAMAQYALVPAAAEARRIIDFVDVDADKWRQYAARIGPPMSWLYDREARRLLAHDAAVAEAFDAGLFVSAAETELFRRLTGSAAVLEALPNGVDADGFAPSAGRPSPYHRDEHPVVFTGAMDYWANADAVRWFAAEVWPAVRREVPTARFHIVGARPAPEVLALRRDDIEVTGRVDDVRPYLQHAGAVVAPMRIARGIQNKVLEGMAMGRPVLTTPMGAEGLDALAGRHLLVEDDAAALAARTVEVLRGLHADIGPAARALVQEHYNWRAAIDGFMRVVAGDSVLERGAA